MPASSAVHYYECNDNPKEHNEVNTGTRVRVPQVSDLMADELITIRRGTTVREAAAMLRENMISGAPVVDAEGKVLGLLSAAGIASACGSTCDDVAPRDAFLNYLWVKGEAGEDIGSRTVE